MVKVPQIEGLKLRDFLDFAASKPETDEYLPDEDDWLHEDKVWICNVLNTLDPEGVHAMILEARRKRREHLEKKSDLSTPIQPYFLQAMQSAQ